MRYLEYYEFRLVREALIEREVLLNAAPHIIWPMRFVLPHVPDAWVDYGKTKVGYEIPFNRHFYVFEPPRDLAEIDADLREVTDRIKVMIEGLAA